MAQILIAEKFVPKFQNQNSTLLPNRKKTTLHKHTQTHDDNNNIQTRLIIVLTKTQHSTTWILPSSSSAMAVEAAV